MPRKVFLYADTFCDHAYLDLQQKHARSIVN